MSKTVTLVTSLNTKRVVMEDDKMFLEHLYVDTSDESFEFGHVEQHNLRPVMRKIIPIIDFHSVKPDGEYNHWYIAIDPEVEELLQLPFSILQREAQENKEQQRRDTVRIMGLQADIRERDGQILTLTKHKTTSFWQRIKYVFTGVLGK